jgi:hypothetical protein
MRCGINKQSEMGTERRKNDRIEVFLHHILFSEQQIQHQR